LSQALCAPPTNGATRVRPLTFDRIRRQQRAQIGDGSACAYASRGASFESSRGPSCAGQLGGGRIPYPGRGVLKLPSQLQLRQRYRCTGRHRLLSRSIKRRRTRRTSCPQFGLWCPSEAECGPRSRRSEAVGVPIADHFTVPRFALIPCDGTAGVPEYAEAGGLIPYGPSRMGPLPARRHVRRQDPQARRPPRRATDEVRLDPQSQDGR
jgi:hypothetical protein